MSHPDEPLTLYPSLRGLIAVLVTPHLLIVLGAWGLTGSGGSTVALVFIAVGVGAAIAGLLGYPRHVIVTRDGICLVSVLRRRRLPWEHVRGIERTRPTAGRTLRRGRNGPDERRPSGGLLARGPGRRHWMLTDHVESPDEYDHLCAIVEVAPGAARVQARRPFEGTPPTSLYRRRSRR